MEGLHQPTPRARPSVVCVPAHVVERRLGGVHASHGPPEEVEVVPEARVHPADAELVDQGLEGRGVRVGMDRPILIVYPVCENTVDERVSAVLLSKLPDVQATTGDKAAQQLEDDLLGDQDALIIDLLASIGVET